MSSFISHFKFIIFALFAAGLIESATWFFYERNHGAQSNFLTFNFPDYVNYDYAVVYEKIKYFGDKHPEVIQVGDSSGYMGIRSNVVNEYLKNGDRYANLSCCTTVGWDGQYGLVSYFLRNTDDVKAIVLYNSPLANIPSFANELGSEDPFFQLGGDIRKEFASWRRLIALPSLQLREDAHKEVFYRLPFKLIDVDYNERKILDHSSYQYMVDTLDHYGGYTPDPISDDATLRKEHWDTSLNCMKTCKLGMKDFCSDAKSDWKADRVYDTYAEFAKLARVYGVKVIIAHQVVPCTIGDHTVASAQKQLDRLLKDYPEVSSPFPLIETWEKELFTVPAHIEHENTDRLSQRLGLALQKLLY